MQGSRALGHPRCAVFAPYRPPRRSEALPVLTLTAALSFAGAALRALRTAAGRRALHLALLVAGLFALGLLCEGQAHAADGAPSASAASAVAGTSADTVRPAGVTARPFERDVNSGSGRAAKRSPEAMDHRGHPVFWSPPRPHVELPVTSSGRRAASSSAQPGSEPAGRPVPPAPATPGGPVTSAAGKVPAVSRAVSRAVSGTVGEVVRSVGDGLAGQPAAPAQQWPVLPPLPTLPSLPGLALPGFPGLPGLPGVPGFPGLPGLPTPPVRTLPAPWTPPHQPGGGAEHRTTVGQRETGAHRTQVSGTDVSVGECVHRALHSVQLTQTPPYRAPDGDPSHLFGGQSLADGGTPRHGDGQGVAFDHRAPLKLVPGAAAVDAADGTRDRHRDITEFPG